VRLHFAFHSATKIFMLVDYVERGELFYIMRQKGKFNEEEARFFAAEIFLALEYLHKKNIMYRDLKPENVLLGVDWHVKITDFGISKVFANNFDIKTFSMCGTPEYIAPEVLKQKGYTFSSDWFSFVSLFSHREPSCMI
jgi:serine/threonine protein kinase